MRGGRVLTFLLSLFLAQQTIAAPALTYFPLTSGAEWTRKGDDGSRITIRVVGPKTVGSIRCIVVETRTVREGSERVVSNCYLATDREVLIVEAAAGGRTVVLDPPRPLLMLPPAMGKSWTWSPRNLPVDIKVTDRWVREETVRVPAGTFRTVKVESSTVRGDVTITIQTWYALGVGVVKVEREQVGPGVGREGGSELISYRIP